MHKTVIIFGLTAVAVFVIVFSGLHYFRKPPSGRSGIGREERLPLAAEPSNQTAAKDWKYPQIERHNHTTQELAAEIRRRDQEDSKWEWKVPIRFVGQVVDENLTPVGDAKVDLQWTDLSSQGTSHAHASSDQNGFFSLSNVQGKRLLVRVSKDGYYPSEQQNRLSFEFANPFEENFYQGLQDKPVLFHLHTKGTAAKLVKKSVEVVLPGGDSSARIELMTGKVSSSGQLEVQASKPWPPRPMSPRYDWEVTLSIPDGGLVETSKEFAFRAPEIGYSPTFHLNMAATVPSWGVSVEKTLYFRYGTPAKYGRLSFRTSGNSRYIFVDYLLNPTPGDRNLEFDPAKQIKVK
jgi:hypothetical protein